MTLIEEAIISGFIGEAISRCTDISWTKIKGSVKNRKNKHQNIESQIYSVVVNVLNQITYNEFEDDQDKIYQAAERLLISYKDSRYDNIEVVRSGLQILGESVNPHEYVEFTTLLYQELCKDDYEELYRQIRLLQHDEESNKTLRIERKVDSLEDGIKAANEKLDSFKRDNESSSIVHNGSIFQHNKKKDYIKNWNSRLFLHIDNDENPITLSDAFIMPDFVKQKSITEIAGYDDDKLDEVVKKFTNYEKTLTMLITGVPGIGKTSITSWLANEYQNDGRVIVLRFRDWKRKEIEEGLLNAISNRLCCENEDLENKILIIDGFDEMKALDIREKLLNDFISEIKDFENFKCIITSRPAYINSAYFQIVIQIIEFDEKQIDIFFRIIKRNRITNIKKIKSNLEVLGIPVILYMAIMSDIDISENPTKPELYNRIFAERGGIFDKFFDGKRQYSKGSQIMRNPDNIMEYLNFLREVAFKMFEKNNLSLDLDDLEIPKLDFGREKVSILDFPIKHFFESTEMNIEFIHKSIYDYFVSEYIFKFMNNQLKNSNYVENNAGVLGELLKSNILSPDIIEYLKFKIDAENIKEKFNILNQAFRLMLQDGMTYYTKERCRDVIKCEKNIFVNMLEILHIWDYNNLIEHIFIEKYLKSGGDALNLKGMNLSKMNLGEIELRNLNLEKTQMEDIDLENINFEGKNLMGIIWKNANLIGANLAKADLADANLENTDLTQANLSNAILINATLVRVDLIGADLRGADLKGANLTEASLYMANLINARLDNTIFNNANINYSIWEERQIYKILKLPTSKMGLTP